MKISIFLEDDIYFHPEYLKKILKLKEISIFLVIVKKNNFPKKIFNKLFFQIFFFDFYSFIKILKLSLIIHIRSILFKIKVIKKPYTLKDIAKLNLIPYTILTNVNQNKVYQEIKSFRPEIILNSSPFYFEKKFIKLANRYCINRHSSVLPSYSGIMPVFHSLKNSEKIFGSTLHLMNQFYDDGKIIKVNKFNTKSKNLYIIYKKIFKIGGNQSVNLIKELKKKKKLYFIKKTKKYSYFSFSTIKDYMDFKKNGCKFI